MIAYIIYCLTVFTFLALIWKADNFLNAAIKMVMIGGAIWSTIMLLNNTIPR